VPTYFARARLRGTLKLASSRFQTHSGFASTWAVVILRGKEMDRLGTVEAPDQREAYRLAVEQFNVPVERQNRLFVRRLRSS
jgi:hypothetical protein